MLSSKFVEANLEVIFYAVLPAVKNAWHDQLINTLLSQHIVEQCWVLTHAADPNTQAIWNQDFLLRGCLFIFSANDALEQPD